VRADQARLLAQASQLESWRAQLADQQARLEELEAAAAEALAEARDAAAAALQERDQVRPWVPDIIKAGSSCTSGCPDTGACTQFCQLVLAGAVCLAPGSCPGRCSKAAAGVAGGGG
jgi:hypothetical protein